MSISKRRRSPRQLTLPFQPEELTCWDSQLYLTPNQLRDFIFILFKHVHRSERCTDQTTGQIINLCFLIHISRIIKGHFPKKWRRVKQQLINGNWIILKHKEADSYYVFGDRDLGTRLKSQIEGV